MAGNCSDSFPARDSGDHSYFAYLVVDDADSYYCFTTPDETDIIKPLRDKPWGIREFVVRTNDGHRIMFGQERER